MVSADLIQDFVAPHYAWLQQEVIPPAVAFWHRLDVPAWEIYSAAFQECAADVIQSSKSTGYLSYLTFRPLAILAWIIIQFLWDVAQVLFQLLLEKGWVSLQKGVMQAKAAIVWFYLFQRSLSRKEILGEIGIVTSCVLLYYLQKWLKRQTYFERVTRWYRRKSDRLIKSYTKAVHQVAQVSLILAMTLPHLIFFGVGIAFKIIFPSVVKWLAYDTYTTVLLSVWYPLICTLGWIHKQRHGEKDDDKEETKDAPSTPRGVKDLANTFDMATPKAKQCRNRKQPAYMKTTSAQKAREQATKRRTTKTGVFPKTSPSPIPISNDDGKYDKKEAKPAAPATAPPEASTTYWLRYWAIYALVQATGHFCSMVPVFGRFVARHPFFLSLSAELKLLFFIWIFFMEKLLGNTAGDTFLAEALPLRLLHRNVMPLLLEFDAVVSEAISKETWKTMVHSKARRVLEVFVMVRFISEPSKDWLLHILDESRTLLLPSLSLLMPGFITQFGVSYVQFLVPSAKSSHAKGEAAELLYLQYWILHCLLSGFLTWVSSILWWIPFSRHAILLAWCHLSFPQTIAEYYSILEMELVAFGILHGDPVMAVHDTRTVQLFTALTKRLPSAVGGDDDDDDVYFLKEAESNMTDASKKSDNDQQDKSSSIDPSICLDAPDQIEVSIYTSDKQKTCDDDTAGTSSPTEDSENIAEALITKKSVDKDDESVIPEKNKEHLKFTDKSNEEPVVEDDENSIPNINQENSTKMLADKSSKVDEDSQPDLLAAKTSMTQDDELSDSSLSCNNENDNENTLRRSTRIRGKVRR